MDLFSLLYCFYWFRRRAARETTIDDALEKLNSLPDVNQTPPGASNRIRRKNFGGGRRGLPTQAPPWIMQPISSAQSFRQLQCAESHRKPEFLRQSRAEGNSVRTK